MKTNELTYGVLAEFSNPADLMHGAEKMRDEGFKHFDCHSPFPIHGMDQAMGLKRSTLGYIVFVFGLIGAVCGFALQAWVHTKAYPLTFAGKPYFSWQAFIIVTFGLMVLAGAFAAVLGLFHLSKLPKYFDGLFYSKRFGKFSDDGFFISVDSKDPKFHDEETYRFLESIGGTNIELIKGE